VQRDRGAERSVVDHEVLPPTGRGDDFASQKVWLSGLVALFLVLYAVALWVWFRPDFIQNWRESDTQTIAVHLAEPGSSIFYPRIDWAGDSPGYVETEFQLYTWLASRIMKLTGPAEWPGQLVSLLCVVSTAWLVFTQLAARYGGRAAAIGVGALVASRIVVQSATTVQPEALCLLLFAAAWFAFQQYLDTKQRRWLAVYAVSGAVAMLVKPTAAQLGVASFLLVVFDSRDTLRKRELWLAWAFMVGLFVIHLFHARSIYLEYGNTFGVLSGGDTKLPKLEQLLMPSLYVKAGINSLMWGLGPLGAAAVLAVLVQRRNVGAVAAFLVATAVWTILALRYTTKAGGNHYHVLGPVLAAQAIAQAIAQLPKLRWRPWAELGVALAVAFVLQRSLSLRAWNRHNVYDAPAVEAAKALERHAKPGELVVVRSVQPRYDTVWKTISNFEDPRVFYMSHTRGWPVGSEIADPLGIDAAARAGARYYVEPLERESMPAFDAWLDSHATLVETTGHGGKVYALIAP
jgi:4-amino-4-deoxy-L-arabinose transferase-like glycosyltransferase